MGPTINNNASTIGVLEKYSPHSGAGHLYEQGNTKYEKHSKAITNVSNDHKTIKDTKAGP